MDQTASSSLISQQRR